MANNKPASTEMLSRISTRGASQPSVGASFRPISKAINDTASAASAAGSKARGLRWLVTSPRKSHVAASAAIIPGTMLMRNSQCPDQVSVIQPPTIGPTVGARTAATPAIEVARPCERCGNSRNTAAKTAGISVPPAKP